jgi:hypothetical protein
MTDCTRRVAACFLGIVCYLHRTHVHTHLYRKAKQICYTGKSKPVCLLPNPFSGGHPESGEIIVVKPWHLVRLILAELRTIMHSAIKGSSTFTMDFELHSPIPEACLWRMASGVSVGCHS